MVVVTHLVVNHVSGGRANINVPTGDSPMSAICVNYTGSGGGGNNGGGGDNGGGNPPGGQSCSLSDNQKRDCGYMGINQQQCEAMGCCWSASQTPNTPWCYYPQ